MTWKAVLVVTCKAFAFFLVALLAPFVPIVRYGWSGHGGPISVVAPISASWFVFALWRNLRRAQPELRSTWALHAVLCCLVYVLSAVLIGPFAEARLVWFGTPSGMVRDVLLFPVSLAWRR